MDSYAQRRDSNQPRAAKEIASKIAELYRKRWTIEAAFGELAEVLNNEIDALAYPKAALFAFCVGLLAYNVLSVVKAALRSIHGEEKVARDVRATSWRMKFDARGRG